MLNAMSRYDIAAEALRRSRRVFREAPALIQECETAITKAIAYAHAHFEDPAEITNWTWTD